MANEVKILISAVDKASATLNKIQSELTQTGQAGKTGFMGMSSGALAAVGGVAAVGAAVYKTAQFVAGSVNDWVDYNEEIRKLSIATGAAPEDLSRMMQAADDLGVSMDSLQTAFKLVAKNGIQPTIENIAELSDELIAIEDPTERAEEAARLFGRQWAEIAPFILDGSQAIKEATAGIDDNMVTTQKSIDQSREYKEQIDLLADSWTALRNKGAQIVLPVVLSVVGGWEDYLTGLNKVEADTRKLEAAFYSGKISEEQFTQAMVFGVDASSEFALSLEDTNEKLRAAGNSTEITYEGVRKLALESVAAQIGIDSLAQATIVYVDAQQRAAFELDASNSAMSYANQAIGEYITNTNLAQQAQDALGLATGELTLTEIELRDGILRVTQALQDGLITPKQWADMMVILGDETIIAADKVAILRGYINSLKDKTVTITVNMVKTGNYAAGATGVEIEGVSGNAGGGGARLPANPATNKVTGGKGQSGLDMVVPPGYPNDQFPIFASSGERAIIVPENARYITGGYNGIGGGVIIQNFNIYQQPGQSAMALAEIIAYQASRQSTASAAGIKYAGR